MRLAFVPVAAFVLVVVACSDSASDSDPITGATLQSFSDTLCNKTQQCGGDFSIRVSYGTIENCKSRQQTQRNLEAKSPGYQVKEGGGKACVKALQNLACDQLLVGALPAECKFKGTLALGAKCIANTQCVSGSCFVPEGTGCGTCSAVGFENGDCTNARCDEGLTCNSSKKCVRPVAIGGSCNPDVDCQIGSSCVNSTCTKTLESGAACSQTTAACDITKGVVCVPNQPPTFDGAGSCQALTYLQSGQQCPNVNGRIGVCENGTCVGQVCKPNAFDGAACGETDTCQAPAVCRNGVCGLLDSSTCR